MKIRFNLLPKSQKKHLHTQKNLRTIMAQEIYVVIILMIFIMSLFAIYFLLKTESIVMQEVEAEIIAKNGYAEVLEIRGKFNQVHEKMNKIDSLDRERVYWSQFFALMSEKIGPGVFMESIEIGTNPEGAKNHVRVQATAKTREDVVSMKDLFRDTQINDAQCFDEINVPESDLAAPTDVTFSMEFDVNLDCIR